MNLLTRSNHKGFTLIETLFSILIFSAALISLFTIAGRGISATEDVRQESTAHYLAQEGLEVVRNIRDSNFLATSSNWDAGFSTCTSSSPCNLDYGSGTTTPALVNCAAAACDIAELNGAFVSGSLGTDSGYNRQIFVTSVGSDEYLVASQVKWMQKTIPRTIVLRTILKKWQ